MRTLIILLLILAILSFLPSPTYKKTTTCLSEYECTSESSFELGPSLFDLLKNKFQDTQIELE